MEYTDLLSRLGVASAHPGGFKATKQLIEQMLNPTDSRILEVGCGTGRTACHLAKQGYQVTALDQHPLMLQKAKNRAAKEGINGIDWVRGDVRALPFENDSFDILFAESVTIFTDIPQALKEYHRVLKPNGRLLDREMVLVQEIPLDIYTKITDYFGMGKILTADEWLHHLQLTGFHSEPPHIEEFLSHDNNLDKEDMQEVDFSALLEPGVGEGILKYTDLMLAQELYFGVCIFSAFKTD